MDVTCKEIIDVRLSMQISTYTLLLYSLHDILNYFVVGKNKGYA
jgi:hypothetical protein